MEAHTDHSPAESLSVSLNKIGKKEENKKTQRSKGNKCLNKVMRLDIINQL